MDYFIVIINGKEKRYENLESNINNLKNDIYRIF